MGLEREASEAPSVFQGPEKPSVLIGLKLNKINGNAIIAHFVLLHCVSSIALGLTRVQKEWKLCITLAFQTWKCYTVSTFFIEKNLLKRNDAKRNHDYLKLLTQKHHELYILRH